MIIRARLPTLKVTGSLSRHRSPTGLSAMAEWPEAAVSATHFLVKRGSHGGRTICNLTGWGYGNFENDPAVGCSDLRVAALRLLRRRWSTFLKFADTWKRMRRRQRLPRPGCGCLGRRSI
jgi:hypothetical protein